MKIGASFSTEADAREAAVRAALEARVRLEGAALSLAGVFTSPHPAEAAEGVGDGRPAALTADLEARVSLEGASPSRRVLFPPPPHAEAPEAGVHAVHEAAGPQRLVGCVGDSVGATPREIERSPAVSVWLAQLP